MKLFHMVAAAEGGVIGKAGKLPWHYPEDLKFFKSTTINSTILMGRKTFDSIGKPLPGRENFVLSRSVILSAEGAKNLRSFSSIEEALRNVKTEKAFIIGGAEIFKQTFGKIDGIYFTNIKAKYEGDAFYPAVPTSFKLISNTPCPSNPALEFLYYERI